MSSLDIESRLTVIEAELAALKSKAMEPSQSHPIQTLEKIHGSFESDPAFSEAMRLGRKWRQSDRPALRKASGKRK